MALRVNETLALQWEFINLDKGTITIRHTLWRGENWNPKTQSSMGVLKIPAVALEALQRARLDCEGTSWLFPTRSGRPVCSEDFHKRWKKMVREAGLPESITYHALRHGAASYLLNQRVPLPVVSKYLRHSNPSITARLYSHIVYGSEGLASDGIDAALG
jgi:integrase